MFSGKTEELIRRLRRAQIANQNVQIFKPAIDKRYLEDYVVSHAGSKIPVTPIDKPEEILERLEDTTRIVGIDEAQFFADNIVEIVQKLANRGLRVIMAGLDMDYRGIPFGPMPILLSIAESVTKVSAICTQCGAEASRSQRLDTYEARCRMCHKSTPAEKMESDFMTNGDSELNPSDAFTFGKGKSSEQMSTASV
jgi:thymidine kinase